MTYNKKRVSKTPLLEGSKFDSECSTIETAIQKLQYSLKELDDHLLKVGSEDDNADSRREITENMKGYEAKINDLKSLMQAFSSMNFDSSDYQKQIDKAGIYSDQQKDLYNSLVAKKQLINDRFK